VLTGNTQFEYELKKMIREEINRMKDNLSSIASTPDYHTYTNIVGKIWAFERVCDYYCDEVNSLINKRE
jgi:hypothetical protein